MIITPHFDEAHSRMQNLADATAVIGYEETKSVWNTLTGRDTAADFEISFAVDLCLPQEYAPLMRRAGGIPAQTFISMLGKRLAKNRKAEGYELRGIVNAAWADFADRAALADDVINGTGWDLSDAWETVCEIEDDHIWARPIVKRIMALAGRMYHVLRGHHQRVPDGNPQEVKSVTVGGDLARLMPQEHALLGSSLTADLKAMDILQEKAQQVEVAGDKPAGRGPLVICIDESDSMWDWRLQRSGVGGGASDRNVWAKACFVAMTRIAHEEKRMVHVVHFSSTTLVRHCKPGDRTAVLEAMNHFLRGGTAIAKALRAGNGQVRDMAKKGHVGADVVMITDGRDSHASESHQEAAIMAMAAKGVRLWTVGIDVAFGDDEPLRKFAEYYVHVSDANTKDAGNVKGLKKAATGNLN